MLRSTLKASQRLSNNFRSSIDAARPIREGLQAWYSGLPDDLRFKPRADGQFSSGRRQGVAVLHFSYLTLELLLYRAILRPLARSPPPPPISPEDTSTTSPRVAASPPVPSPAPWLLDDLVLDSLELDQLPEVNFPMFREAAEATLNAAEKCAGIIVNFVATLAAQDFDVLWYPCKFMLSLPRPLLNVRLTLRRDKRLLCSSHKLHCSAACSSSNGVACGAFEGNTRQVVVAHAVPTQEP